LEKPDDVIAYRVSGRETFGPGEDFTRIQSCLFDWKREGETERDDTGRIGIGCRLCGQECIDRVSQII
jgi:hypothetical protein